MIWRAGRDDECYDIPVRLLHFAARPSIFPCLLRWNWVHGLWRCWVVIWEEIMIGRDHDVNRIGLVRNTRRSLYSLLVYEYGLYYLQLRFI